MPDTQVQAQVVSTLRAVVHHADGTDEDLGIISTSEVERTEAPLLRLLHTLKGVHHGRR
jgi:hypothetical protein